MKKTLLLLAAACCLFVQAMATTYTVTVADFSFSPSTLTVHPGDVITWTWSSGSHTTTSTTLPTGAPTWDQAINATNTSYSYTAPSILGTYNYKCTPHAGMGMVGSFTVVSPTEVSSVQQAMFSMYPNPATTSVRLQLNGTGETSVFIADMSGRTVMHRQYTDATAIDIDTHQLTPGIYTVTTIQNGSVYRKELSIR